VEAVAALVARRDRAHAGARLAVGAGAHARLADAGALEAAAAAGGAPGGAVRVALVDEAVDHAVAVVVLAVAHLGLRADGANALQPLPSAALEVPLLALSGVDAALLVDAGERRLVDVAVAVAVDAVGDLRQALRAGQPLVDLSVAVVVEPVADLGPRRAGRRVALGALPVVGADHFAGARADAQSAGALVAEPGEALVDQAVAVVVLAVAHLDLDALGDDVGDRR